MTNNNYCPRCGLKLDITNWGRYFCKNCGMIDKDELDASENKSNGEMKYVG